MDATLHADSGCTARPDIAHPFRDFIAGENVGTAAQRVSRLAFRKRTELAAIAADVGLVDERLIPFREGNGYPLYRLEWQSIGSLQRRLRNCLIGMRAEHHDYGAPEYVWSCI